MEIYSDVYNVTSRKNWHCKICGAEIAKGEICTYLKCVFLDDCARFNWYDERWCRDCKEKIDIESDQHREIQETIEAYEKYWN